MSTSKSTTKTQPTAKRRFYRVSSLIDQVFKLFNNTKSRRAKIELPRKEFILPSVYVTSPEGDTTQVE